MQGFLPLFSRLNALQALGRFWIDLPTPRTTTVFLCETRFLLHRLGGQLGGQVPSAPGTKISQEHAAPDLLAPPFS